MWQVESGIINVIKKYIYIYIEGTPPPDFIPGRCALLRQKISNTKLQHRKDVYALENKKD